MKSNDISIFSEVSFIPRLNQGHRTGHCSCLTVQFSTRFSFSLAGNIVLCVLWEYRQAFVPFGAFPVTKFGFITVNQLWLLIQISLTGRVCWFWIHTVTNCQDQLSFNFMISKLKLCSYSSYFSEVALWKTLVKVHITSLSYRQSYCSYHHQSLHTFVLSK